MREIGELLGPPERLDDPLERPIGAVGKVIARQPRAQRLADDLAGGRPVAADQRFEESLDESILGHGTAPAAGSFRPVDGLSNRLADSGEDWSAAAGNRGYRT
jgi:hypothetical protein